MLSDHHRSLMITGFARLAHRAHAQKNFNAMKHISLPIFLPPHDDPIQRQLGVLSTVQMPWLCHVPP